MNKRTWVRSALAGAGIAAAAVAALALPAGAAVSVQSQSPSVPLLKLGSTAKLDANGAVVFAPIRVTCAPGSTAYLTVSVTEAVGNDIARGTAGQSVACTGTVQQLRVAVTPSEHPFKKGVAFGQAGVDLCSTTCVSAVDVHNIQIVK